MDGVEEAGNFPGPGRLSGTETFTGAAVNIFIHPRGNLSSVEESEREVGVDLKSEVG